MKEKDYKKLYEDVVALAKDGLKDGLYLSQSAKAVTEFLFPQLKETEDEKVKRELTKFLINFNNGYYSKPSETEIDSWIKWIKKQDEQKTEIKYVYPKFRIGDVIEPIKPNGFYRPVRVLSIDKKNKSYYCESDDKKSFSSIPIRCEDEYKLIEQKPTDKVEPKFKVGDWITNGYYTWKVTDIKPLDYILQSPNGDVVDDTISYVDENLYLWTIQDVKDGDVLAAQECYVIFKEIDGLNIKCYCTYHYMGLNPSFHINTLQNKTAFHPATKEQCELLFQKMKEAGYEWDAEKKELKEVEQKTAWSEKDEKMLNKIIDELTPYGECPDYPSPEEQEYYYTRTSMIDWLKSLKDRVQPQSQQEWSKEDSERLLRIHQFIWANRKGDTDEIYQQEQDADWLMSIIPQSN